MAADLAPAAGPGCVAWRRGLWTVFLLFTTGLIVHLAGSLDWAGAFAALRALPLGTLLAALACAAAGHAIYASYEMLGRPLRPTRWRGRAGQAGTAATRAVPARWMLAVGFVSFAFKLNLGTVVGGVALRYRLYGRLGLAFDETTRILAASVLTNWIGYVALAGALLLAQPPLLPAGWGPGPGALRAVGAGLLLSAVAYAVACGRAEGREWHWRRHALRLPSLRVALLQFGLSALHWLLTAAVCWVLLQRQVDFASVLNALLVSAVAGLITHVPGGVGVIEAVFIGLLQSRVGQAELLAALLGFRAVYYLLPLMLAVALFFVVDRRRAGMNAGA
ncbi:YbhN family protein [Ideonella sp.]|uniref:lysylphosphatidylglycerol synthase transmembrane domain-containing protein n=1 Tax=Ideonella sp. TaxID=1929293 RepID=UPI002B489011|nr:YbhN family protein [Ideonella sp.]HJV70764.1 YbhN family protein [Ideonella sp.]